MYTLEVILAMRMCLRVVVRFVLLMNSAVIDSATVNKVNHYNVFSQC